MRAPLEPVGSRHREALQQLAGDRRRLDRDLRQVCRVQGSDFSTLKASATPSGKKLQVSVRLTDHLYSSVEQSPCPL